MLELLSNQIYLLWILLALIIGGLLTDLNVFQKVFKFLSKWIKNKKILVTILSTISGILPISGRLIISAPVFNAISSKQEKSRDKLGILNYLSTHHYYFWSPLESTVIVPMAAFGLTYLGLLSYLWPLLAFMVFYTLAYIYCKVDNDDIVFDLPSNTTEKITCKRILSYINWILLITVGIVLFLSAIAQLHSKEILDSLKTMVGTPHIIPYVSILAFLVAFALGSSSKFIGITVLLSSIFGMQYFTYFFALEFAAYLLSPTHKCIAIAKEYFHIKFLNFLLVIGTLALMIIILGALTILKYKRI